MKTIKKKILPLISEAYFIYAPKLYNRVHLNSINYCAVKKTVCRSVAKYAEKSNKYLLNAIADIRHWNLDKYVVFFYRLIRLIKF